MTEPMGQAALRQRLEELERENRDLRTQLQKQALRNEASTARRADETRLHISGLMSAHADEIGTAASRIERLEDSGRSLQANEDFLREILESISDAFYALDGQMRLSYVNRRAGEIWGKRPRDLVGRVFTEVFPEVVGSEQWRLHETVRATREPLSIETRSAITGRWLSVNLYPAAHGGVTVYFQDTTKRRQAEEALRESERQLRASEERLRKITDNLPALISYVDADQRYRFNNKAYESWIGRTPESLYGVYLWDAVGRPAYERVKPYIEAALAGRRVGHEWWAPFRDRPRFVKSDYIPDFRQDGSVAGFFVLASDLTDFERTQDALAKSEARLRLSLDAGRMAIWETDTVADSITVSPELVRLLGFPPDAQLTTEDIRACYYPGERERLRAVALEALARGENYAESELRVVWPDGSLHWLLLRAEMQDVQNGVPARTLGVALDITGRKKAEEHRELLINELNHRVKNTLATVQSIVSQSLRNAETASEARQAVEGRLFALSRAHDVLTRENWDGASLREVVQGAVAPFQGSGRGRFEISGIDVRLPPRIALALAMAIQELGTNAVKYGALSSEAGYVAITWAVTESVEGQRLEMVWRETGGPPVSEPGRRGFGTRLVERSLAQELDGTVAITFAPTGVVCSIDAPLKDGITPNRP